MWDGNLEIKNLTMDPTGLSGQANSLLDLTRAMIEVYSVDHLRFQKEPLV
jgi:hypothetical protein